jgi:hypothetical protein
MNQIVNLEMNLRKELELESQGYRRTRRWIGDAEGITDPNWYQAKASRISANGTFPGESSRVVEPKPRMEPIRSAVIRFFSLPMTRRQPARSKA